MVQNIVSKKGIFVSVDWLAFTIKNSDFGFVFNELSYFFVEKIISRGRGARGYSDSADILDGGFVAWSDDKPQNGIHVVLNSRSLAVLDVPFFDVIKFFAQLGGVATRLDVAFDDTVGFLDLVVIADSLKSGQVSTRWKSFQVVKGKSDVGRDDFHGHTIYVGSRQSESFLRFYDKKAERENKGFEVEYKKWVRCELELKGKKADKVFYDVFDLQDDESIVYYFSSLLYGLIDFKAWFGSDELISRVPTVQWWVEFLSSARKAHLSLPKKERSIEAIKSWIEISVAPSLAVVADLPRGDIWLGDALKEGRKRWKRKHKNLFYGSFDELTEERLKELGLVEDETIKVN